MGIDLALGLPMDKIATSYEYMFLPDYLREGVVRAAIKKQDTDIPLVKESITINEADKKIARANPYFTPFQVLGLIFLLGLFLNFFRVKRFTLRLCAFALNKDFDLLSAFVANRLRF